MDDALDSILELSALNKAIVGAVATTVGLILFILGTGDSYSSPSPLLTFPLMIVFGLVLALMIYMYIQFYRAPNSDEKKNDTTLFVNKILYVFWMLIFLLFFSRMGLSFFKGVTGQMGGGGARGWSKRR